MALVGKKAPSFKATAVVNGEEIVRDFSLDQYLGKKHVVFFFYTKDLSPVCPTELHAFQERMTDFEERNTAVVACSTDTEEVHQNWLKQAREEGGIQGVQYPIVADTAKTISDAYGVLAGEYQYNEEGELIATGPMLPYRGLFVIDRDGVVQHELINHMPFGRNVEEAIRMIDAVQFLEENGQPCPANWQKGKEAV